MSVRSKSVSERRAVEPAVQLGQPEPGEDRDGHRAPAERSPAAPERAHRGRPRLALEPADRGHADEDERDRPADPDRRGEHVEDRRIVSTARPGYAVLRAARATAVAAGGRLRRPGGQHPGIPCTTGKEGPTGEPWVHLSQNDHGPPPGTRDRPSDTGGAARLAAAACSRDSAPSAGRVQLRLTNCQEGLGPRISGRLCRSDCGRRPAWPAGRPGPGDRARRGRRASWGNHAVPPRARGC